MHDGRWLGMGGMGSYWLVPLVVVVVVLLAVLVFRGRSRRGG